MLGRILFTVGTIVCATSTFSQAGSGNTLNFNESTNDYVRTSANNALDAHHSGTFECWFKLDQVGATQGLFNYSTLSSSNSLFVISIAPAGQINIQYKYGGSTTAQHLGTTLFQADRWYHVAIVADGSSLVQAWVNGSAETLNFNPGSSGASGTEWFADISSVGSFNHFMDIGSAGGDAGNPSGLSLNGNEDEVRVWNRALTQTEIRQNMCQRLSGAESGLTAYWRLDEGTGLTANDLSPNGNDGILN